MVLSLTYSLGAPQFCATYSYAECDRDALPSGAYTCACRKAYRLAYRSQRETPRDRAQSGAFALRRKLGADGGVGDYVTKPKGMHRRTFERARERIDRAEGIVDGHKRKAIGHSNVRGIRVAKSRTGAA
jgi:hypothetical protein